MWSPSALLSAQGTDPRIALGRDGQAAALWCTGAAVAVATHESRAGWTAAREIGPQLQQPYSLACRADVGIDAEGGIVAIWAMSSKEPVVAAVERPAGSSQWSSWTRLSEDHSAVHTEDVRNLDLAVNAAGDAAAVWIRSDGASTVVEGSFRRHDGSWEQAVQLSVTGANAADAQIVIDASGTATAAWRRRSSEQSIVWTARHLPEGWEPAEVRSSESADAPYVALAVNPRGDTALVWPEFEGDRASVRFAERPTGTEWQPAKPLSVSRPATAGGVAVTLGADGSAIVLSKSKNGAIEALTRQAIGDGWSEPAILWDICCGVADPKVVGGDGGRAVAIWRGGSSVFESRREGDRWTPARTITSWRYEARIAEDGEGNAVLVGDTVLSGVGRASQFMVLDGSPPAVQLALSGHLRAGRQVGFSVQARDSWSQIRTPSWRFGDGVTAKGFRVRHTYRRPGRYSVALTVVDSAGNATVLRRAILLRK